MSIPPPFFPFKVSLCSLGWPPALALEYKEFRHMPAWLDVCLYVNEHICRIWMGFAMYLLSIAEKHNTLKSSVLK